MKNRFIATICLVVSGLLLFMITGCGGSGGGGSTGSAGSTDSGDTSTQLGLTVTAIKKQQVASSSSQSFSAMAVNGVNGTLMQGEMLVENIDTATRETHNWSIYLNEDTFEVESNKTVVLEAGVYQFSLLVAHGDQQYAGISSQTIADGENTIAMTLRPVIGDTVTSVSLVTELADFKFRYDASELAAAGIASPNIGITVNGGLEEILAINPATGITDDYLNLPQGEHTIELKLYDGSLQKGKSITSQQTVQVTPGYDIAMDLVALHGETVFSLTEEGGEATFRFSVPADVIDEAGGINNLDTTFSVVGPKNPLRESALTLTQDATGDYEAEVTLSDYQADEITISVAFTDAANDELLGSCNQTATIGTLETALTCPLTLRRRAVVSGNLLGILALNVLDRGDNPVAGAVISENGHVLGITGSAGFGTAGYLKVYLPAGDYTIRGDTSSDYGTESVSLEPLGLVDRDLILTVDKSLPFNTHVLINNGAAETESTAVTLALSAEDNLGVNAYYVSELDTPLAADSGLWIDVSADTTFSLSVPFTLTDTLETKTVYAWFRDVEGGVVAANDTIEFIASTAPTGLSVSINNNAASTGTPAVNLTLSAEDNIGVDAYFASDSAVLDNPQWITIASAPRIYSATVGYTMTDETRIGRFTRTVFVWFRDAAGNVSAAISDDIEFDNPVLFVNAAAAGDNSGSSWDNAYTDFQTAINNAASGEEIWVTAGTYTPGTTRESSFSMRNGVALYGGFAGAETERDQRDWETNPTILSCDIGVADVSADNCYHVFYHNSNGLTNSAILDGFQITGGNASEAYGTGHDRGSGMYNRSSSPMIRNSVFSGNTGDYGSGMYNDSSSPSIHNTVFSGNAARWGGGMYNDSSSPSISNSTFSDNTAELNAAGMYNKNSSSPSIRNSVFSGNTAGSNAGGMLNTDSSSPLIRDSVFSGNTASSSGGGMFNSDVTTPTIINSVFSGNTASSSGGGMHNAQYNGQPSVPLIINSVFSDNDAVVGGGMSNSGSTPSIFNSVFSNNTAERDGGGMWSSHGSTVKIINNVFSGNTAAQGDGTFIRWGSTATIRNSTLWDNGSSSLYLDDSLSPFGAPSYTITYSNIQGGYTGEGNIDADPLFVDAANGDFHLQAGSPVINSGSNAHLPADSTDLDGDGNTIEPLPYDLDGNPRIIGGAVDMGPYEYTGE